LRVGAGVAARCPAGCQIAWLIVGWTLQSMADASSRPVACRRPRAAATAVTPHPVLGLG
jgi:hypothetical protein